MAAFLQQQQQQLYPTSGDGTGPYTVKGPTGTRPQSSKYNLQILTSSSSLSKLNRRQCALVTL